MKMHKKMYSWPVILVLLIAVACGSKDSKKENEPESASTAVAEPAKKEIRLVCKPGADTAASGTRSADIYISINGNETILKTGEGECHTLEPSQYAASNIPAEAVMALGISRAGGGDYFYLLMKDNKPVIFEGTQMITQQGASYTWKQMEMTFPE